MTLRTFTAMFALPVACISPFVEAQTLTRGPYLQMISSDAITIRWQTDQPCDGHVRYGARMNSLDRMAKDEKPTTEHEIRLTGLQPATVYFYSVGTTTAKLAGGTEACRFKTAPLTGFDAPVRLWVLGDSGTGTSGKGIGNAEKVRNGYGKSRPVVGSGCVADAGRQRLRQWHRAGNGPRDLPDLSAHGLEPWKATRRIHRRVREWRPLFEEALASEPGVEIEDKNYSLAIHFRRSRSKKRVRAVVAEVVRSLQKARLIRGIEVVNIVPSDAPHKGMALERERSRLSCDTAIYVGDDETDEDVFALDQPGRLLGIRVGRRPGSRAEFYSESQAGIDSLLRLLARLREDTGTLVKRLESTGGERMNARDPGGGARSRAWIFFANSGPSTTRSRSCRSAWSAPPASAALSGSPFGWWPASRDCPPGAWPACCHLHPSTVSGLVKRLADRGLISRSSDGPDRRRACLRDSRRNRPAFPPAAHHRVRRAARPSGAPAPQGSTPRSRSRRRCP